MHVQIVPPLPQFLITTVLVCLAETAACNAEGRLYGSLAQLVEHPAVNRGVRGSNPLRAAIIEVPGGLIFP